MKTFMFPGQGSQIKGMGGTLFDEFSELTQAADSILGYSIKELCLEDPRSELNRTQFTQPALYVVNALSYWKKTAGSGSKPDFLAGHSLGEINALLAAECFDFETGLRLVRKRGELMGRICTGSMGAVLNAAKQEIETILQQNGLSNIDLANYNTPSQIVISGLTEEVSRAAPLFQQGKMLYHPLVTSGAFHSRFMRAVEEELRQFLAGLALSDLKIPVIANVTARPYENGAILDTLAKQVGSTVRWCESMQYLMAMAAMRNGKMQFEEVGHGDVLTRLAQTIQRQTSTEALSTIVKQIQQERVPPSVPEESVVRSGTTDDIAAKPVAAGEKVAVWNRRYPIGTRAKSLLAEYVGLETRTQAVVLFGHRAAVYMKGYNGYFDLDEIVPV
jgi:malonyl CoA-acyl carrier protein transacylase